jgi:hypothetical protein
MVSMASKKVQLTVNKEEFCQFLNSIMLRGANIIDSGMLEIREKFIKTTIISPNKTIGIVGILNGDFCDVGEIGVDNFTLLKNSLQLVPDKEVALNISDNKLSIKTDKSKINLVLRSMDYIKNFIPDDKYDSLKDNSNDNPFSFSLENVQELNKYYSLVKPKVFDIVLDKKQIKIIGDNNDNTFELNLDLTSEIKPAKTRVVSEFLLDVLSSVTENVGMGISNSPNPIYIHHHTKNSDIEYFIAPINVE